MERSPIARLFSSCFALLAAVAALGQYGAVHAQEALIRSDLPLWSDGDGMDASKNVWPKSFTTPTGSGFMSPFDPGDWKVTYRAVQPGLPPTESWMRIELFGFDSGMFVAEAPKRERLGGNEEPSVIVELGGVPGKKGVKLYAIQIGFSGGSRYLAIEAGPGIITHATFLEMDCDKDRVAGATMRDAHFNSMFRSRYCAVDSPDAMRALAFGALARDAVIGEMEWVGPAPPDTQR